MTGNKIFKDLVWQRTLAVFMSWLCILSGSSVVALQSVPKKPAIPKRAMPPYLKTGPKKASHFQPKLSLSANPSDADLCNARAFLRPLVPMSVPRVPGENQALAKALASFKSNSDPEHVSDLTGFLASFPKSRWRSSLELNLGLRRFETGYLTDALTYWKSAWELAKDETGLKQRCIADEAVAQLVLLEARLGRKAELERYLSLLTKRKLSPAAEDKVEQARIGLSFMNKMPGIAYKCGPHALNNLLAVKQGKPVHNLLMFKAQSSEKGTSLAQLQDWATQLGLHYQAAKRSKGAPFIVPSVMHWKLDHFAAIVQKDKGRYRTKDPTFGPGGNIVLTSQALESETDGYFLVPSGPLPTGWRALKRSEAQSVWGKGYSTSRDPKGPCQDMEGTDGQCCGGLATASSWSMQATLNIQDTPLGYRVPYGPNMNFLVNYNYLEENTVSNPPFTNLANTNWTFNWVSYLTLDSSGNATVITRGGGSEYYAYPYQPSLYSQASLVNVSSGVYQRQLPDGSFETFDQADGTGRIFLTAVDDPQSNEATIQYDTNFRITTITDDIGQQTTLTYGSNTLGDPGFYVITQITDPFSRSCTFTYDSAYTNLLSTTDVIGLTSQFHYLIATPSLIDRMTTPYGTTGFFTYNTTSGSIPYSNALQFLYPDGTTSVMISQLGQASGTFYFDREAMMLYPSDVNITGGVIPTTHCKTTRWCFSGSGPDYNQTAVPYYVTNPLENQTTNTYPGGSVETPGYYIAGAINRPSSVTRTISGSTTQTWQYTYNSIGRMTQSIDPSGRTFSYTYDSSQINLIEKDQTLSSTPEINGIWSSFYYGLPQSYEDGSGQVWNYTYDYWGNLSTSTDPNGDVWTYTTDSNGYLTQIQGPLSGNNDVTTFSYDGYGRVYQVTDSEGYTITYSYDDANRVTQITYPDGTSEQTIYDKLDAVLTQDRLGRWTQHSYDSMDQLTYEIDPLGRKTQYTWCACGSLSSLTDPNGNTTSWQYDLQGRLIQKTYADQTVCSYSYDNVGRKSSCTDALGQITNYSYYVDNSLYQVTYSSTVNPTSTVTYTYDPNYQRRTSVQNGWGTISYSYNPYITSPTSTTTGAGRISGVTNSVIPSSDISYTYDVVGRITNRSVNGSTDSTSWAYDAMSRATSEANTLGTFNYNYVDDVPGYSKGTKRLSTINYPNSQVTNFNWSGNLGDQRLQGILNLKGDGTCLSQFACTYDPAGEVTAWQQQQGPNSNQIFGLAYDLAGQLTAAQSGTAGSISPPFTNQYFYSYDPGSNRVGTQQYSTQIATIGGSPTVGDTLTVTVYDSLLSGGQESITYTVLTGGTLTSIATGLSSAVNADTHLQAIGVTAASSAAVISMHSASPNITTYSPSTNSGATETISLGTHQNALTNTSIVGTATAGDVLTITVNDPALSGGQESVSYTVQSGDGLANIASGLNNAINADSNLSAINVSGKLVENSIQISSGSANVTTYTQSISTGATEGMVFSLNTNIAQNALIAGTVSTGDTLTLTVYDAELSGGSESVDYTVTSGNTLANIASGLASAVNGDVNLSPIMSATSTGAVLSLGSFSLNPTTYRATTNSGATETITLGVNVSNSSAKLGGTQYQFNNLNELVSIGPGGTTQFQGTTNKAVQSGSVATNAVNIQQAHSNPTTYGIPQYSSATETITFSAPIHGNATANVSGTVTPGDVLSFLVYNASLPGGQEQVFYTVQSSDTLSTIASALTSALNADSNIAALGITATASSASFSIVQPTTTYAASTSSGATESIVLGNNNNGNTFAEVDGMPTSGDTLTITTHNQALSGGQESASYTVTSSDTLITIAAGLATAINADAHLSAIGLTAANNAPAILHWSESFNSTPLLSGSNPTKMSATDGGGNTASTNYTVSLTAPNGAQPSYDLNGNTTSDGTNSYLWDAENRIIQITYPGSGNNSQFTYDGLGRCVEIVETRSSVTTSTKQFVWSSDDFRALIEERDAFGSLTKMFFSRGQTVSGANYFYTVDHLGSIREMTDSSGNIAVQYQYDPYGRVTKLQGTASSDFQFTGYYVHGPSGLDLASRRQYSSPLGRFLTRDPSDELGGTNLYAYAVNDPIGATDPTGLDVVLILNPQGFPPFGHIGAIIGCTKCNSQGGWQYWDFGEDEQARGRKYNRLTEFYNANPEFSAQYSAWFPTNKEEDAAAISAAEATIDRGYFLLTNNCADLARNAAIAAGVPMPPKRGTSRPFKVFEQALNAGGQRPPTGM
jgi:RHS repeat-associated protein